MSTDLQDARRFRCVRPYLNEYGIILGLCKSGDLDGILLLRREVFRLDYCNKGWIDAAAEYGHEGIIKWFYNNLKWDRADFASGLVVACRHGQLDVAKVIYRQFCCKGWNGFDDYCKTAMREAEVKGFMLAAEWMYQVTYRPDEEEHCRHMENLVYKRVPASETQLLIHTKYHTGNGDDRCSICLYARTR